MECPGCAVQLVFVLAPPVGHYLIQKYLVPLPRHELDVAVGILLGEWACLRGQRLPPHLLFPRGGDSLVRIPG